MRRFWISLKLFLVLLILSQAAFSAPITVAVSIAPQKFVVKGIGGNLVKVLVLVPPGAEPHTYEPSPRQMARLSKAALYLTVGVEMERVWLERFRALNPSLLVRAMDRGVKRLILPKGGYDPHVWLSTENMKVMAANALKALVEIDPAHSKRFRKGYESLLKRINLVEKTLKNELSHCKGKAFVAMHPAWRYFAHQFGMEQLAVEHEGRRPTTYELLSLVKKAKRLGVKVVLIEPQFSSRPAKVVAREIGAKVVVIDPLALQWDREMLKLGDVMAEACR